MKRRDTSEEPDRPVIESTTERDAGARPRLSVVIASSNDASMLDQCIKALAPHVVSGEVELIVVRAADRSAGLGRHALLTETTALHWIDAPARSTVPRLKGLGIAASRAERIALLEDDSVVAAGWCHQAMSTPESTAAVGGAVEPGPYRRALDWAVYFCEFGRFMLPVPTMPNAPLPGNNVVYSRWAIAALPATARHDLRDAFVHAAWQRDAVPTAVNGSLVVHNINTWSMAYVTSAPFHHGRAYAGERFGGRRPFVRAGLALLIAGLPFLKIARIVVDTIRRRRLRGRLLQALPWIVVFVTSWSFGELAGCLSGPGSSASRWR